MKFKEKFGRTGLFEDKNCNYSAGFYFFKWPEAVNFFDSKKIDSKRLYDFLTPIVAAICFGLGCMVHSDDIIYLTRIQLFQNKEEPFFTIVVGFKLGSTIKSAASVNEARFYFPYYINLCLDINHVFFVNTYECFNGVGTWDYDHCNDSTFQGANFDLRDVQNNFKNNIEKYYNEFDVKIGKKGVYGRPSPTEEMIDEDKSNDAVGGGDK